MGNRLLRGRNGLSAKNLQRQLAGYSATAGAALVCTTAAQASTIHLIDSTNLLFTGSAVSPSNLPHAPTTNTAFPSFQWGGFADKHYLAAPMTGVSVSGVPGFKVGVFNNVAYTATAQCVALKFGLGETIASVNRHFSVDGTIGPIMAERTAGTSYGNFRKALGGTGYFGFKFSHSAQVYYGWMRVQVSFTGATPNGISLIPKDGTDIYGAYSDDPLFQAGEVPEPSVTALSGLGLLALGAAGVREMRRRRATVSAE